MKRILFRVSAFAGALMVGAQLYAAPPANDNIANAQQLAGDFGALIVDTTEATFEKSEPYYGYYATNTVWYKWTCTANEKTPFMLAADRMSSGENKKSFSGYCVINVFTNANESADFSFNNLRSASGSGYFCAEPGRTYLISVSAYSSNCLPGGKVALRWWRKLADGEWKILAADGIVFNALGDLPEDFKVTDFPAGVTEIADYAFEEAKGAKYVKIPASVTKIGRCAFADSSDLAWVDYEGDASAVDVADNAFIGTPYCRELPFKLIFDEGIVTNIVCNDEGTGCTTNFENYCNVEGFIGTCPAELVIPEGVTGVYEGAFGRKGNETLVKVTFPSTLKEIEGWAFSGWYDDGYDEYFCGCDALTEVAGIPATARVDDYAFVGSLYEKVRPFELITEDEPDEDSWDDELKDYTKFYKYVYGFHGTCPEELIIPEWVEYIDAGAFSLGYYEEYEMCGDRLSLANLKKVVLPASIQRHGIYARAFSYLPNLEEVVYYGKNFIDGEAFYATPYWMNHPYGIGDPSYGIAVSDEEFKLETGYEEIEEWDEMSSQWVVVSSNLWVYGYCGAVPATIVIPDGVYGIACDAFYELGGLTTVVIPASVKYIGDYAFEDCTSLTTVTIPSGVEYDYIGDYAFAGCRSLTTLALPASVKEMGYGVFHRCRKLTSIAIPSGVKHIDEGAFAGCTSLTTVTIPEGVEEIDEYAFAHCENLTSVTIPASVKYIGDYAFAGCENLASVTFLGNKDDINNGLCYDNGLDYVFIGTPYSATLPFKLLASEYSTSGYYKPLYDEYGRYTNSVWVSFDSDKTCWYVSGYIGTCPEKLDLTQFLTNNAAVVYFDDNELFEGLDTLKELVLPNVEYFNDGEAFRNCANLATVTGGGVYATDKRWLTSNFQGTPWLETAVPFEFITRTVTTTNSHYVVKKDIDCCTDEKGTVVTNIITTKVVVGYYGNVPAKLTFPEDVGKIDHYLFEGCDNITEVIVPGNVKEVGDGVFAHCDNLQNVEFQEGVEEIGYDQFYGCGDGMQVILPASAVVGHYVPDEDGTDNEDFMWRGVDCKWIDGDFDFQEVFFGIVGDVDVVAPRVPWIYDRAFLDDDDCEGSDLGNFGRTCVEYYTHVVLDTNGGATEESMDYYCYEDVVTGLPTPTLSGNVFREWWDDRDNYYRNGDVWGEGVAQVYLKAEWAEERVFYVYGLNGPTEIRLGAGDDYETLLRVLEDMYGANPQSSRHGLSFRYWTVDGEELNHRSVIGEGSVFGAYFDEFNPLTDRPEAMIDATAAQTYDGYILDYKGNDAGTIQVKVGKPNAKTGEANVSAKVQMFGDGKLDKLSFKADPKGKWKIATDGATKGVTLSAAKATDKIVIDISEKGIFGKYGAYDIIGSRNTSKKEADAYAKWSGKSYDIAFKTKESTGSAFTGGYSGVNVSIANKGKVKITGVMADGAKVNASAQLLISDKGEGCVNVFVPMYSGKKGGFGFVLWIDSDFTTTYVESVNTWESTDKKSLFTAELEALGAASAAPSESMTFSLEAVPAVSGATVPTGFLPTAMKVSFARNKLTVAKANKVKLDKSGTLTSTGGTDNDVGLKLTYTAKTGSFKGSFTVYAIGSNSKLKKLKANVNGVFVNGVGYGAAVIKDVGSLPVVIR